ncbi:hypothetical protein NXW89_19295 [Bacteroides thetaiotaomicron]|nr:hypothetical protein [Bacteroides thetaiotaomicron]
MNPRFPVAAFRDFSVQLDSLSANVSFNVTSAARPDGHGKKTLPPKELLLSLLDRNRTGRHHQRKADQEENVFPQAFESRLNRYGFLYLRPYAIRIIIIGNFIVTPENSVFVFIHAGSYARFAFQGKHFVNPVTVQEPEPVTLADRRALPDPDS